MSVCGSGITAAKWTVDDVSCSVNVDEDTYLMAAEIVDRENGLLVGRTNGFGQLLAYVVRNVEAGDRASHCVGYLCTDCLKCGHDDAIVEEVTLPQAEHLEGIDVTVGRWGVGERTIVTNEPLECECLRLGLVYLVDELEQPGILGLEADSR